ncbi:MAG: zinc dependent phospholipase C family protein [Desulfuromonadaceae bacterium]|nr:zinc dependent phospholipase C family protein [Desulfuromonadaceae bacterium]
MAYTLFFIIILLFIPGEALAWGIGVHLQLGSQTLEILSRLPSQLQPLLSNYPYDFLYGFISADITLGKKFTHYLKHCHSWRIGQQILAAAKTDPQRACAYGYLGHLAADTVAHSYMVPYKMVRTFNTAMLKHLYWEMRFESRVAPNIWQLARTIARKDFRANDAMMSSVLSRTIFSFSTNKRLFNSILLLSRLQRWQKMLQSIGEQSKWTLEEENQGEYLVLAQQATESILTDMEQSPFWKADPAGERALYTADIIRKNLNLLWLDGKLPEAEAQKLLAQLKRRFRQGITNPEALLDLLAGY